MTTARCRGICDRLSREVVSGWLSHNALSFICLHHLSLPIPSPISTITYILAIESYCLGTKKNEITTIKMRLILHSAPLYHDLDTLVFQLSPIRVASISQNNKLSSRETKIHRNWLLAIFIEFESDLKWSYD